MRILICTQAVDQDDPALGFFHRWIEEFAKHCESVTVVCLRAGRYSLPAHVHIVPLKNHSRVGRARELIGISWQKRASYEAVFVHMNPEYLVAAGLLWRLMGKRTALWYEHKKVNMMLRIAAVFANSIFTASSGGFRISTRKTHVMGHGMDTAREVPAHIPSSRVRLMTAGRISPVKKIEVLIDAFVLLKARGVDAIFKSFGAPATPGDDAYEQMLRARLTAAGEDPAEVLVGKVPHDELPAYRAEADYFLHASETGSLDKTVLDAILSGVIPLSSSEAYTELFGEYAPELLYPAGSSTALAERIQALRQSPEEHRETIRTALRARVVELHSLERLVPRIIKFLL
jgi:glycosyltransferase involved in cell wall biosynthesis